jgi:hypothetical protein
MFRHRRPNPGDIGSGDRRARQYRRYPTLGAWVNQTQRAPQISCCYLCLIDMFAVRLIDGNNIGDFQNSFLDALQLIARPSRCKKQEARGKKMSTMEATAISD